MDENTRFLIKRMDTLESRVMDRLDKLEGWKNRAIGIALVAGLIFPIVVEVAVKHFL